MRIKLDIVDQHCDSSRGGEGEEENEKKNIELNEVGGDVKSMHQRYTLESDSRGGGREA